MPEPLKMTILLSLISLGEPQNKHKVLSGLYSDVLKVLRLPDSRMLLFRCWETAVRTIYIHLDQGKPNNLLVFYHSW